MVTYIIRRLLLAIPTFFGCTLVVFTIVQLAPGGPFEQQVRQLKMSAGERGTVGGVASSGEQTIPPRALEELKRYYQYDKPTWERYLCWLGAWPREVDHYTVQIGEERLVGSGAKITVRKTQNGLEVFEGTSDKIADGWFCASTKLSDGTTNTYVFRKEISGILQGNFGKSKDYGEPVMDLVKQRLPISIQFGLVGFIISYVVAFNLGVQKALRHKSFFDVSSSFFVVAINSLPGWALGALLLMFFATQAYWPLLPLGNIQSGDYDMLEIGSKIVDRASHFILPTIAYSVAGIASLTMLMKNSLLENLGMDYVRTAFAKGLKEQRVVWYHALRNSIIPLASRAGFIIAVFLGASYLIEFVFNIDGLGRLSYMSILSRDYTVVFAFTVINVATLLIGNLLSDIILAIVDPRIRFR
ncbi:MAG: ABC transporter permease [Bradyrhizobiaceae bacterium]|nr:ABC transporter permease [Bradyrhizobiaceae bacterium]